MPASSQRLDRHLAKAIEEFGEKRMPQIGGKALADEVKVGLTGLKKQLDELKLDAAAALTELSTEIKNGNEGVKRLREETAAVKAAFAEILGNEQA
jgi:hypothetical protein